MVGWMNEWEEKERKTFFERLFSGVSSTQKIYNVTKNGRLRFIKDMLFFVLSLVEKVGCVFSFSYRRDIYLQRIH